MPLLESNRGNLNSDMYSWKLPSNSGWNMTSWRLRDVIKINRKPHLLVEVILTGRYWERVKLSQRNTDSLDFAKEYSVALPQVLMAEANLKRLYRELARWLKTPIKKFVDTPLALSEELGGVESQRFSIEFGVREDFIVNVGHAACTISYKANALSGECAYLVDQSCVQTFVDGLGEYFLHPRDA
jgi:hypothetical protein